MIPLRRKGRPRRTARTELVVTRSEVFGMSAQTGEELESLLAVAVELRDRVKGRRITYSKKVFIPLTNLCRDYCGYCTFRHDPGEAGAHTMTPDEVLQVVRAGEKLGCTE